mmetsp:Transcript_23180/g.54714  ORF Transcript_23180/g.54714 Transcript_23180/m.54714 type:complete len:269 (+) Transcript_23180:286-1092(+)|eukprot:CAMPEP_0172397996 /NCGR_PEP_ID=MMETSP1061-20121228/33783_1 /TAXON_ID=37318 /ORGANISM="Pseudo-nitzschia pungens, Strain cf. pungens" /LENGTH=268 /DNA_ID=CAMNT_0013130345 /DNA_START=273 /DNA_END=1079 /DNA_ORIENTATION=+
MDFDRDSSMSSYNNGFAAFSAAAAAQEHQQHQQQFRAQQGPMFGLIAATAPLRTDFRPVDGSNNTKFTLTVDSPGYLPSPLTAINELVFFLLPGAANAIPPNSGVLVYWQVELSPTVQSGFELLGCLTLLEKQSDIFRTGWSEREEFLGLSPNQPVKLNIGISIEPLEVVRNLTADGIGSGLASSTWTSTSPHTTNSRSRLGSRAPDKRPMVAQKIAQDLYNFMLSFDTGGAKGSQQMTVPANIFDRWWRRFENKLQRDPNFFLKNSD